ncbi:MAG: BatA domain-containing protein [Cellulophaga sp.]
MQFKYPELLWALFLLLIPIFIHLFQLRRFKKIPFTNVKLLQEVVIASRKSSTLKKWLLLFTRMAVFAGLILAFAQPFFAKNSALKEKESIVYLDNSFSMQANKDKETLFNIAVQNLLKTIPKEKNFSLFTNDKTFKNVVLKDIQNDLLSLTYSHKQLNLKGIYLKANTLFSGKENTIKNLIIISDFQKNQKKGNLIQIDSTNKVQTHLVQLIPDSNGNIAIDTVYMSSNTVDSKEIMAVLSSNSFVEAVPVSLYNKEELIAKTSAVFGSNKKAEVLFSIPQNSIIDGVIKITDQSLSYDNQLYFNFNEKEKIQVLVISDTEIKYLERIFAKDEFNLSSFSLKELNYSIFKSKNLIVLNELSSIPTSLSKSLMSFTNNGGSLVVIPAPKIDVENYNTILNTYYSTSFLNENKRELLITDISFTHPIYKGVFEKKISNFQYPKVASHFRIKTTAPIILSYENGAPFLVGIDDFYLFTAAISVGNSNFKNSPLIVPAFYKMGVNSLKQAQLYNQIGNTVRIDVPTKIAKDAILKITKDAYEFIPEQRLFASKVTISLRENPSEDGIYTIKERDKELSNISFNYSRNESKLTYLSLDEFLATTKETTIAAIFNTLEKNNSITELWKWFVIFALFFILGEVLIQKYFK